MTSSRRRLGFQGQSATFIADGCVGVVSDGIDTHYNETFGN